MSRAFIREDVDPPERSGRKRAPSGLPPGAVNYITARGAARLQAELTKLRAAGDNAERIEELEQILGSIQIVEPPDTKSQSVTFGATGKMDCLDAASGNVVWSRDVAADTDAPAPIWGFSASPLVVDGLAIIYAGAKPKESGKGLAAGVSPTNGSWENRLLGSIADVPTPDRTTLADQTRKVYSLTPYSDASLLTPAGAPIGSPIPGSVGGSSPIKYVFYVIRENRTYDQILGDMPQGNGSPGLTLFGNDVT